ncbi:winged helix DNA-binding domain-containing protein [Mucilaginibacter sp. BJC16-A38]|uniref:winged helix-turn-helix domain-containing protein n=1 Tax=Mucilaginibacter phenanthrenivorans TaxID=1234842 RepID=UPI0021574B99|nr:crosslink repair DNA glycosylase YcaQ family protein [Mucilaginibacter phenanthrenivorans]MCR8558140.1 winged helix DNA-binding domain-containing protein [Mucilaginibacter phenanthrenivorans]
MAPLKLSKSQARKIILHAAGLAIRGQFGTGCEAVYRLIDHLGFVQLDTNYVVERAHHHVMAARIPDYQLNWLDELIADGRIFEYFTSDAGYIPMHNFRFSLPIKEAFSINRKPLMPAEGRLMKQVLDRIEREGPLMVGDFENDRQEASTGWWDWRPAKIALERLYLDGKLMITRTKKFQKVYDLPMNLVTGDTDITVPTPEEFARYVIRRTLGALGIAQVKELSWRARYVKGNLVKRELEKMVTAGEVLTAVIDGVKASPFYMLHDQKTDIELSGEAFILSPFDILNVFRHRLRDFFDFDYQVECFVPAAKRKYGYFSLPVLVGDTFVARMDAKADRKQKLLIVHNLHFEAIELTETTIEKIVDALKAFIQFNQCRDIIFKRSNHEAYLNAITTEFQ